MPRGRVADVGRVLGGLEDDIAEPLVEHEVDEALGTRVWIATLAADALLEAGNGKAADLVASGRRPFWRSLSRPFKVVG